MVERTLLNIKPDAVARNLVGEIIHRIEDAGYRIVALDKIQLTQKEAETFYAVHSERPFFKSLVIGFFPVNLLKHALLTPITGPVLLSNF